MWPIDASVTPASASRSTVFAFKGRRPPKRAIFIAEYVSRHQPQKRFGTCPIEAADVVVIGAGPMLLKQYGLGSVRPQQESLPR